MGSTESVNQFIDRYGTHVITEYEVGDVMYQVYVFGERTYAELKDNFAMSQRSEWVADGAEGLWTGRERGARGGVDVKSRVDSFFSKKFHVLLLSSVD